MTVGNCYLKLESNTAKMDARISVAIGSDIHYTRVVNGSYYINFGAKINFGTRTLPVCCPWNMYAVVEQETHDF